MSDVESRYQATVSEDRKDLMCDVVTVILGVYNSVPVIFIYSYELRVQ
jgi:hypothetical protein